jgi:hypothetical protein
VTTSSIVVDDASSIASLIQTMLTPNVSSSITDDDAKLVVDRLVAFSLSGYKQGKVKQNFDGRFEWTCMICSKVNLNAAADKSVRCTSSKCLQLQMRSSNPPFSADNYARVMKDATPASGAAVPPADRDTNDCLLTPDEDEFDNQRQLQRQH